MMLHLPPRWVLADRGGHRGLVLGGWVVQLIRQTPRPPAQIAGERADGNNTPRHSTAALYRQARPTSATLSRTSR
jgi:hypothetical protein